MRICAAVGLCLVLFSAGFAQGDQDSCHVRERERMQSVLKFAAGVAVGLTTYAPGAMAGWLVAEAAGRRVDFENMTNFGYVTAGAAAGYALGCAAGTWFVGSLANGEKGSFTGALAGAAVGGVIGAPISLGIVYYGPSILTPYISVLPYMVLTAAGSVVGYNLSRPKAKASGSTGFQLMPPVLALGTERLLSGRNSPTVRARLLNVSF
jgi:hypothetical protein